MADGVKRMRRMGLHRAAMRTKRGSASKDVFYYLVGHPLWPRNGFIEASCYDQNNDDGAEPISPPPAQAIAEGMMAIVAGSDTTSSTTCNIMYFLLRNTASYKRLQEEVDSYYPPGSDPLDTRHYKNMVYLDAVMCVIIRRAKYVFLTKRQ